jgi:hypothetical protein
MKYQITKEQYSKLVYRLIEIFFKDAKFTKWESKDRNGDYLSYDITVDGEDVAWINSNEITSKTKRCKHELIIYDTTILMITDFVPIFRKKIFSKILIKYFSDIIGEDIDCIDFDMKPYGSENAITYKKKFKNKK